MSPSGGSGLTRTRDKLVVLRSVYQSKEGTWFTLRETTVVLSDSYDGSL